MRVLLTTPYDLSVVGGVNRHTLDLLNALSARGLEVRVVGPASNPAAADDSRVIHLGRVSVRPMNGAQSRVTLDLNLGEPMRRLMEEFKPDIVHLQEPFLPTLNTFALLHAGDARRVGTFHTYSETSLGYLWAWPWCDWVNARLDARVAVSEAARSFATRFHPARYHVVTHGVQMPMPKERSRPKKPFRVLFVGRADEPRKGFKILTAALQQLERETPGDFALTAVGPATERGEVTAAELAGCYASTDVCVVPSLGGESFGLVALEALAHGVPVIASRIRGYAEWLETADVGALFAAGDAPALALALREMANDPARYHARCQRARLLAQAHSWTEITDQLIAIYSGRKE